MPEWKHFEIPRNLIGETIASGNDYIQTYRKEILLPKGREYEGYCFQHPAKLVSEGSNGLVKITYNDDFVFKLVKKDREPGKKYKRYSLTVPEILAIYEPAISKKKAQLEKAEQRRRAQIGSVEVLACADPHNCYWAIVLCVGKKWFWPNGREFCFPDDVVSRHVVAENVVRGSFEEAHEKLMELCEEYRIVLDVKHTAEKSAGRKQFGKKTDIYNAIIAEMDKWEEELYKKISEIKFDHL